MILERHAEISAGIGISFSRADEDLTMPLHLRRTASDESRVEGKRRSVGRSNIRVGSLHEQAFALCLGVGVQRAKRHTFGRRHQHGE